MRSTCYPFSALLRIVLICLIGFACCTAQAEEAEIAALIAGLSSNDATINQEAASRLVLLGDTATASLGELFVNKSPEDVKLRAIDTLRKINSPAAVASLVLALRTQRRTLPTEKICNAAVEAIGNIGSPALPVVFKEMQSKDVSAAATAARICGIIGGETVVQPLIGALKSKQASVRREAAASLGRLKAKGAVTALLPLIKDSDLAVRHKAIYAVSVIGDPQAIPPIAKLLKDKNYYLSIFAGEALTNFTDPSLIKPFVEFIANRPNVEKAMEKVVSNRVSTMADQKANMSSVDMNDTAEYIRRSLLSAQYLKELYPQVYMQEYRRVEVLYMLIGLNLGKYGAPAKEQLMALRDMTKSEIVRQTAEKALTIFSASPAK